MELLTYGILGIIGCGLIASVAWMWGYFKRQERTQRAQELAERERMRADAKTKEAEIRAKPKPDTWAGTVDRL